jgi:hypothetical protein
MNNANVHDFLYFAIENKRLVEFEYQERNRVAEPHDYGIKDGVKWLLIYQIRGQSESGDLPNWRWVEVNDIEGLRVLEETFPGGRAVPTGKHKKWDQLFKRVSPAT